MMTDAYYAGFRKVANAYGVNPEGLMKLAWESTPANEFLLGLLPAQIPFVGNASSLAGVLSGNISDPYVDGKPKSAWLNLLPGVSSHRLMNRMKAQTLNEYRKHGVDAPGHLFAETLGPTTAMLPGALLGGLIGAAAGHSDGRRRRNEKILNGAGIGLAAGALPTLAAMLAAGITRRRTEEEQVAHDRGSHALQNLLIPGYGVYNRLKRLGRSQGDREEEQARSSSKSDKRSDKKSDEKSSKKEDKE